MKKIKTTEHLELIEENIRKGQERIMKFRRDLDDYDNGVTSTRMMIFNPDHAKRQLVVTEKALRYFQRKHLRVLMQYPSVLRMADTCRQMKEHLLDKDPKDLTIEQSAFLTAISNLPLPTRNEVPVYPVS